MNKKIVLILLIATVILTGCANKSGTNMSIDINGRKYKISKDIEINKKTEKLEEINFEEYSKKIDEKEEFVLLVYRTGCQHCEAFEPKMNEIIKKSNIKIYSINIADMSEKEYQILKSKIYTTGTPTLVHFKDGKYDANNKIVGNKDMEYILKFLVGINYLEEK